jgi:hypothetical protein
MVMHLAVALVTYNLLVHVAPVRPAAGHRGVGTHTAGTHAAGNRAAGERDASPAAQPASRGQHRHSR